MLITRSAALRSHCRRLEGADYVAADTEFIREKTYRPELCPVQLCGPDRLPAAIDALADSIDLSPLTELLHNERVLS